MQTNRTKGMTLIEVIVSAAILAVIAIMVASVFLTMGNMSMRTTDTKATDAALESSIAAETGEPGYTKSPPVPGTLEIPDPAGSSTYSIPLESYVYSSDKTNQGFTVFKFKLAP